MAPPVLLQTCPRTAFAVTPSIAHRIDLPKASRIGPEEVLDAPCGTGEQVPVGIAPTIGPRIEVRIESRTTIRVAVRTTS
jgi:hypothetical protein